MKLDLEQLEKDCRDNPKAEWPSAIVLQLVMDLKAARLGLRYSHAYDCALLTLCVECDCDGGSDAP